MREIYMMEESGKTTELVEVTYESEFELQELIADHPELLAGNQIDPANPRRWLLLSKEAHLAENKDVKWAVDHLFLDQDAVPTLVEVKRNQDTRMRREVIGQVFDYAAMIVDPKKVELIKKQFESSCRCNAKNPTKVLSDFLGSDINQYEFWANLEENISRKKLRMIFVCDTISQSLKRVIEFLSDLLSPAEIYGIEVRQFIGNGLKIYTPYVIGFSAEAIKKRTGGDRKAIKWCEETFLKDVSACSGPRDIVTSELLIEWAKTNQLQVAWGKGSIKGSFTVAVKCEDEEYPIMTVYSSGRIDLLLSQLKATSMFESEKAREEIVSRFNEILPKSTIKKSQIEKRPGFSVKQFRSGARRDKLIGVLDWLVGKILGKEEVELVFEHPYMDGSPFDRLYKNRAPKKDGEESACVA